MQVHISFESDYFFKNLFFLKEKEKRKKK